VHIVHTSSEDSCNLDVEIIKKNHTFDLNNTIVNNTVALDNEILFANNERTNHYEQCEINVQDSYHNFTTDNIKCNNEKEFKNAIATWAISYNIPHNACNSLLTILQKYTPYKWPSQMRTVLRQ